MYWPDKEAFVSSRCRHALVLGIRAGWLLVCAMLLGGSAAAQEPNQANLEGMSIEDLAKVKVESVYGASKFLQKASDTPASVTIVTGDEIRAHGFRTVGDVLRSVRGFYVINDRNYSYVGVRGFSRPGDYNARVLFLLDGHRTNDDIYDGAFVGTEFPVDIDLIERIEITRGPSSSVYGTGAFVAVVNVITKRGRDLGGSEVSAEAGSWNTYKGRATYGERFDNRLETLVSGSYYSSQGQPRLFFPEFNSPATNNGIAANADGDRSYKIFADIIYRDLNIHVLESSRTKHIPTASFGTVFNDPRTRTTDAPGYIDVQYHHVLGSWEALGRASYDWYDYHGIYIYDYANLGIPPYTQNYDAANGSWWDFQGDASRTFFKHHQVTLGGEVRQDLQERQVNYDIRPYQLYLDDRRAALDWALYFQDEYKICKNLAFVAGLRSDWREKASATLSPRAGLVLSANPSTDIKAMYSRAFREPSSYESFYAVTTLVANPTLQPERIRSWEVDVEHRFGKGYHASVAGFLNRMDNLIENQIDQVADRTYYVNSTPVQTKGLEWELGAKWGNGMEGVISHTLQESRNIVTGETLTNSPKQLGKLTFSAPLIRRKLFAGVDAQYVSERRTIAQTELGGFFIANVTFFTRKLSENFDLSGGVYNLLNKQYADSGSISHVEAAIPQDGRSFRIQLTYRPHSATK